jgi:hypothetical protein
MNSAGVSHRGCPIRVARCGSVGERKWDMSKPREMRGFFCRRFSIIEMNLWIALVC